VYREVGPLYVATPEALGHAGVDPASVDPGTEVLTAQPGSVYFVGGSVPGVRVQDVEAIDVPPYSSPPRAFITAAALDRHGWESVPAAWLVEAREPLTGDQLAEAREQAAEAGLTVEARRGQEGLSQLRSAATAVGHVLALGIVSMTVGLVRSDAAADMRTLTAVGASRRMRRAVTGATAGALALLGAVLGTAGAYAGLSAGYADDLGALLPVPVLNLVAVTVGLPVVAAAAAWLLGGGSNQPSALARNPLE
jgi:putative ABC transport system permease protein